MTAKAAELMKHSCSEARMPPPSLTVSAVVCSLVILIKCVSPGKSKIVCVCVCVCVCCLVCIT